MKFLRYGDYNLEKPGLWDAKHHVIRDLSGLVFLQDDDAWSTSTAAAAAAAVVDIIRRGSSAVFENNIDHLPAIDANSVRIGSPLSSRQIGKIIGVGLNYKDHAQETGAEIPKYPVLFSKATSSVSGPYDDIVLPPQSQTTDYEIELGVVIGKDSMGCVIPEQDALDCVLGYTILHDVSERSWQLSPRTNSGGQWFQGKSYDSYCPIGPWLVTPDELPDPTSLHMTLSLNSQPMQSSNTRNMIFNISQLISYISQHMSLCVGDIIATGTPAGVGHGRKPPIYLQPGDVVQLSIEGLGVQQQRVVRRRKSTTNANHHNDDIVTTVHARSKL